MEAQENLIRKINDLYPIDSEYVDTNEIGEVLLISAIKKVGWQKLPDEFLAQYLIECANEEEIGEVTQALKQKGLI